MKINPSLLGPLTMVLGAAFLVVNDAIIKLTSKSLPVNQIIAIRSAVIVVICLCLIVLLKRRFFLPLTIDLLLRTMFTVGNVFVFVSAVAALPFAVAVLVDFTNIIYVAILAPMFLAERLTLIKMIAICVGFLGAAILLSPEFSNFGALIFLPLFSALLGAGREIWTRRLGKKYSSEVLTLYAAASMAIVAVTFGMKDWEFNVSTPIILSMIAGVFQAGAMLLMTIALQVDDASFVTPFRLSALIWAILLAVFLFDETISLAQFAGIGLILVSLIALIRSQNSSSKFYDVKK